MSTRMMGTLLRTAPALLAAMLAMPAWAQQAPLSDASVEDLVQQLSPALGPAAVVSKGRAFLVPDGTTHACPLPATANTNTKNLEPVAYAAEGAPQVQLAIQFDYASNRLTSTDRALLDRLASALNTDALRNARFAVAGHTDASGDERLNQTLSCARAIAVHAYLVSQGVSAHRLWPYGFGSDRLLDVADPASASNRRVEIRRAGS